VDVATASAAAANTAAGRFEAADTDEDGVAREGPEDEEDDDVWRDCRMVPTPDRLRCLAGVVALVDADAVVLVLWLLPSAKSHNAARCSGRGSSGTVSRTSSVQLSWGRWMPDDRISCSSCSFSTFCESFVRHGSSRGDGGGGSGRRLRRIDSNCQSGGQRQLPTGGQRKPDWILTGVSLTRKIPTPDTSYDSCQAGEFKRCLG